MLTLLPLFEEVKFPKIPRLNRDVIVTEKIDGTNSGLYINDDAEIYACSRKRWITPEDDNFGFAQWVKENEAELLLLGPGMHWGEWWGAGIQRRYDLDEKRFSLFNTHQWRDIYSGEYYEFGQYDPPECCSVVPILWAGNFKDFHSADILEGLKRLGSVAAKGFMKPEGIIIFHVAANSYFKATIEKDGEWKGKSA